MKKRIGRKEAREALEGIRLASELIKVLRRFFLISWTCSGKSTIRGIRVTLPTKIMYCL